MRNLLVAVHNGLFHADEVFAIAALRLYLSFNIVVTRTRDEAAIRAADIVCDVGGEYDPHRRRYDHHQRGFSQSRVGDDVPFSSFGLVWEHEIKPFVHERIWNRIDQRLVRPIDAMDNGQALHEGKAITINSIVSSFNPPWDSELDEGIAFEEAVAFAQALLRRALDSAKSWLNARELMETSVDAAMESGVDYVVNDIFCPWQEHLHELDPELKVRKAVFLNAQGTWMVQARPVEPGSFKSLCLHREDLRGLSGEELSSKAGIPDLVFVHKGGFIGGATTSEAALQLAALME